jgi:1,4-dihydroxy-2-naphthoate octaprenyltransferase
MDTATLGIAVPHDRRIAFAHGLWRLVDPKIALASFVPFAVGTAIAHSQGRPIASIIAVGAFAAVFLVEVGKNAINDLIDYRSGADLAVTVDERSPFSGGKRVLVDGLLTERDLVMIAWIAMLAAGVVGATVAFATRPALLFLGAAAALVAAVYSMPPVRLSYRGLGEAAVFLTYGPGIVIGSVLLFGGWITVDVLTSAVCLGLMIANVLFINEVPDERADRSAGKNTLVVRLGRARATSIFGFIFVAAFALPVIMLAAGGSIASLGLLAGVIPSDYAVWLLRNERVRPPVAAQRATLIAYVAAAAGMVVLLWLATM